MARQHRLWEESKIIQLLAPAADAGGRTSGYFKLMDAHKAYMVLSRLAPSQPSWQLGISYPRIAGGRGLIGWSAYAVARRR
jgi:hypothetical protein